MTILNSTIPAIYTNGVWIDEKGNVGSKILPNTFNENNKPIELLMDCYIKSHSSVMVRRSVFDVVGLFDEDLVGGSEDHDMWLRIIEKFKIKYIDEPLFKYRIHDKQISKNIEMWLDGFAILDKACKRNRYGFHVKRKRLAVLYYRLGEYDWKHGSYPSAIKYFFLAGLLNPLRSVEIIWQGKSILGL